MKKLQFLMAGLAIFSAIPLLGQLNFQAGYIVLANGDTIQGSLNNELWDESPRSIQFRGPNGVEVYEADELVSFSSGKHAYYRSYNVNYDTTGGLGAPETNVVAPSLRKDRVFLQYLVESEFSLLKFKRGVAVHYYIQEGQATPDELIYHPFVRTIAGQRLAQPGNQFISKLQGVLDDCKVIAVDDKFKYQERFLISLFERYAACINAKARRWGDEPKIHHFGFAASTSYERLKGSTGSIGFSAGMFMSTTFPVGIYRGTWYNELTLKSYGDLGEMKLLVPKIASLYKSRLYHSKTDPYTLAGISRMLTSPFSKLTLGNRELSPSRGFWGINLGFGLHPTPGLSVEARGEFSTRVLFRETRDILTVATGGGLSASLYVSYAIR